MREKLRERVNQSVHLSFLAMPYYRFQIDDGAGYDPGVIMSLPNLGAAKQEAAHVIGGFTHLDARTFLETKQCSIMVSDGAGSVLFEMIVLLVDSPSMKWNFLKTGF